MKSMQLTPKGQDNRPAAKLHAKTRGLFHTNGWRPIHGCTGPLSDSPSRLEFWEKGCRLCIARFWPDGNVNTYFPGGGVSWDELETELKK